MDVGADSGHDVKRLPFAPEHGRSGRHVSRKELGITLMSEVRVDSVLHEALGAISTPHHSI
eukprot:6196097-Amphidinium_carterae.1